MGLCGQPFAFGALEWCTPSFPTGVTPVHRVASVTTSSAGFPFGCALSSPRRAWTCSAPWRRPGPHPKDVYRPAYGSASVALSALNSSCQARSSANSITTVPHLCPGPALHHRVTPRSFEEATNTDWWGTSRAGVLPWAAPSVWTSSCRPGPLFIFLL